MGKFPVVFVSFKGVDGLTYQDAYEQLRRIIRAEVSRLEYLLTSDRISEEDKQPMRLIYEHQETEADIVDSLKMLSSLLYKHYGQNAVLLIDEYDVPLDKAFHHGYYREMVALIRAMFGVALKTNDFLQFAVLTGCLRVSKESIFTGLNNFKVLSIVDARFDEHFGFTDDEVKRLLAEYLQEWFKKKFVQDERPMQTLCQAFVNGDAQGIQKHLNTVMSRMISILDTKARDEQKENLYHDLLLGLLRSNSEWLILSDEESGEGFSDILVEPEDPDAGIVIKVKYASTLSGLDEACTRAMAQIKERRYDERLRNEGREDIMEYGIAFGKKRCKVVCEKLV